MKVYLSTLGCKLNESELEAWTRGFANDGYQVVDSPSKADICVLNTCAVTHVAARKSRQMTRQLARTNPNARLVLTGCYASVEPNKARALPNVALVVPNLEKDRLVQMAHKQLSVIGKQLSVCSGQTDDGSLMTEPVFHPRTRAFVKIQDGCNMSCAYCIIPLARGKEHSRPLNDIVAEVTSLIGMGYKEIILTGVQISVYDNNSDKLHGLRDLVAAILGETDIPRLRLTSIAPWDLDESLLDLFSDSRLCRHLHLSLQSGSDTVLRRMRRPYTTAQFARAAELAREKISDVAITTDVIVGFPGESDVEFEQSLEFVEQMQFSRVHVFPYSARAGTVAWNLPLRVSDAVKESRAQQMQAVADASARAFAAKFVGRQMNVLWEASEEFSGGAEEQRGGGDISPQHLSTSEPLLLWSGYTDNYIRVTATSDQGLHNQITPAILSDVIGDGAMAMIRKSMFAAPTLLGT